MTGFAPLVAGPLTLRPFVPEDAGPLHRLVNDWEVTKQLARVPFPYSRAAADEWIAGNPARWDAGEAFAFAVTEGDALVGCVALTRHGEATELGYWIGRPFWGRGFAPLAALRVVDWGFATLRVRALRATVLEGHDRSIAVLRRLGFTETGADVQTFLARGAALPVRVFTAERPPPRPVLLVVAAALVDPDGRVLLARRPPGRPMAGLWEFPGGKLIPGETPEAALIRELREELGLDVSASCLAPFTFASHPIEGAQLLLALYLCRKWGGTATALEGQELAWVRPVRMGDYPMPPADRPLVAMLRDVL